MRINVEDTDIDDGLRYLYQGEPFTGEVVEANQDGQILSLITLSGGIGHGPDLSWHPDGQRKTETTVQEGRAVGIGRAWHPNGQLAEEREFNDYGDLVRVSRWNEDGSPAPDSVTSL